MKQIFTVGCIALLMGSMTVAVFAQADDWGTSGAQPAPVKDAERSGYWWWPKEAPSDADADSSWGNRGRIYGQIGEKLTATMPSGTLFEFDEATLSESGKKDMAQLAAYMQEHSEDALEIQGHTCNVNLSGDAKYNYRLGLRRADSVKKALVEFGVASNRLSAVSLGEKDPAVANDTVANRALNRRVVFVLTLATS